jgi:molybdenum cofactor synthesis domain-containing protein
VRPPRAAIVIVGDEILAGHTQDTNSHWIAERLRELGVGLARIETVRDDVAEIEATLRRLLAFSFDWVFVVGGLGPTPDDRTYEAVARSLGRSLEVRPEHVEALRRRVAGSPYAGAAWSDPDRSEAMRRMIRLPQGSEALENPVGTALGCVAKADGGRLVVLPGVPRELYAMFDRSFVPRHLAAARPSNVVAELEVFGAEASYWDALVETERTFPRVKLGSYPQDERGRVILRLTGPPDDVGRAKAHLERRVREKT